MKFAQMFRERERELKNIDNKYYLSHPTLSPLSPSLFLSQAPIFKLAPLSRSSQQELIFSFALDKK